MFSLRRSQTAKRFIAYQNSFGIALFITICCSAGAPTIISGFRELYKSHTFVPGLQCQVKAIDIKKDVFTFYLHWNVTTFYGNQTKDRRISFIINFSEKKASTTANTFSINETYPCFCARVDISVIQWNCQWRQPSLPFAVVYLVMGTLCLVSGVCMKMLRKRFKKELQTEQSTG
ncbi:unnamed protein product [Adineta ricciae]|uniref:Uncharacterized protein n=1 Tax=Adineta ricciae TaxID=249248 RepID=A0A813Z1N3_ADIRI|nr:unnamed protein product [Adineta ricciae]CAF1301995.1 unnamed protein product [Adineta ricciae]